MKVYKFADTEHVNIIAGGSLKFGSDRFYRMLEWATGDDSIGDKEEARAVSTLDFLEVDSSKQTEADRVQIRSEAAKYGVSIADGADGITITNHTVINSFPCYILSLSTGNLDDLRAVLTNDPKDPQYGACISFSDIHNLARLIYDHGVIKDLSAPNENRLVKDSIEEIFVGPVKYEALPSYRFGLGPIQADPFRKQEKYEGQREWRIVLLPKMRRSLKDSIIVECPPASALTMIEYENQAVKPAPQPPVDVKAKLVELFNIYKLSVVLTAIQRAEDDVIYGHSASGVSRDHQIRASEALTLKRRETFHPPAIGGYSIVLGDTIGLGSARRNGSFCRDGRIWLAFFKNHRRFSRVPLRRACRSVA